MTSSENRVQFTVGQIIAIEAILAGAPYANLCSADHLKMTQITERRLLVLRYEVILRLMGKGFVEQNKEGILELSDAGRIAWGVHEERGSGLGGDDWSREDD